jgi:hypothetical protein
MVAVPWLYSLTQWCESGIFFPGISGRATATISLRTANLAKTFFGLLVACVIH